MKTNVISALAVQFGSDGTLEILGTKKEGYSRGSVLFKVTGDKAQWLYHVQPDFCKKSITSWLPDGSGKAVLIFEYNLRSELNNPRKLLKSVRNKLMQAVLARHKQFDAEYFKEYEQPYLSSHHN